MSDDFLYVDISGNRKLLQKFADMPDVVKDVIREKLRDWLEQLRDLVVENIQERLNTVSGELADAPEVEILEDGLKVNGRVYIRGIPYARIQEEGGTTRPHEINATQSKALAFMAATGDKAFALHVLHPGSTIHGTYYMRDAYRTMSPKISSGLYEAIVRRVKGL